MFFLTNCLMVPQLLRNIISDYDINSYVLVVIDAKMEFYFSLFVLLLLYNRLYILAHLPMPLSVSGSDYMTFFIKK